jgi:hypothetical protein
MENDSRVYFPAIQELEFPLLRTPQNNKRKNFGALVRQRIISIERTPLAGEVRASVF